MGLYVGDTAYFTYVFSFLTTTMRKLLDFLVGKRHWFLFILLEIVSMVLIYRNNVYQRSIIFSSGNVVTGYIASISGAVTSYLNLKQINKELVDRNGHLEMELLRLREKIAVLGGDTAGFKGYAPDSTEVFRYNFITAQVVSNSVTKIANYITINKGRKDGVLPDMGVVSQNGVVGVVSTVSDEFAVIISLLNPKFRPSCKIVGSNYFGTLGWDGRDINYANLDELPRHVDFQKGDTIVTNGFSSIFPAGIVVGTVESHEKQHDDNFYSVRVKLATNFATLTDVRVIANYKQEEQRNVEHEAKQND